MGGGGIPTPPPSVVFQEGVEITFSCHSSPTYVHKLQPSAALFTRYHYIYRLMYVLFCKKKPKEFILIMTHTSHVQKTSETSPFSRLDISFPLMCMFKCICWHTYRTDLSILTLLKIINILPIYAHVHGCRSSLCRASTACPRLTVIFINMRDGTPSNEDSPPSPW